MLLYGMLLISLIGIFLSLVLDINKETFKKITLASSLLIFIISLFMFILFDFSINFQFVQEITEIKGLNTYIGVDGIPIYFLLLVIIVSSLAHIYFIGYISNDPHILLFFRSSTVALSFLVLSIFIRFFNLDLDFNNIQLYVIELYLLRLLITYVVSGWHSEYTLAIIKEIIDIIVLSLKLLTLISLLIVLLCFHTEIFLCVGLLIELSTNNVYKLFSFLIVFLDRIVDIIIWPVLDSVWPTVKTNGIHLSNDIRELKDLKLFFPVFILIIIYYMFFSYMKSIHNNPRQFCLSSDLVDKIKDYLPYIHLSLFWIIMFGLHPILFDLFMVLAIIDINHLYCMIKGLFKLSWRLIELKFDKIKYKTKEKNLWNYIYFSLFQLIFGLCLCIIPNYFVLFIYRLIFGVGNIALINFILKFEILSLKSIFRAIILISICILTDWSIFRYILSNIGELMFNFCFILYVIVIEICNIEVLLNKITIFMFKDFVLEVYNFINKVKLTKYINNILIMLSYVCILVGDYILKMEGFNPSPGAWSSSSTGGSSENPGGGNSNNLQSAGNQTSTNDQDEGKIIGNNKAEKPETIDPDACFNLLDDSVRGYPNMEKKDWEDFRGYTNKGNKRTRSPSPINQYRYSSSFFKNTSPTPFDKYMSSSYEVRSPSPGQHGRSPSFLDQAGSLRQSRIRTTSPDVTLSNTSNSETPLSSLRARVSESLDRGIFAPAPLRTLASAPGVTLSNTSLNPSPSPLGLRPNIPSSSTSNLNTPNFLPIIIPTIASGLISISPNDNTPAPSTISNPPTIRPDVLNIIPNEDIPSITLTSNTSDVDIIPNEDIPSITLTSNASDLNIIPNEDIPSIIPNEDIPSIIPNEDIPSIIPNEDIPSIIPNEDIPSITLTSNTSDVNTTTPWDNISHSISVNSKNYIMQTPSDPSLNELTHDGYNLGHRQEDSYVGLEGMVRSNMVYDKENREFIPSYFTENIEFIYFRIEEGELKIKIMPRTNTKTYILDLKGKDNLEQIPVRVRDDKPTTIMGNEVNSWGARVLVASKYNNIKYIITPHPDQPFKYNHVGNNDVIYHIESSLLDMKEKNIPLEVTNNDRTRHVTLTVQTQLFLAEYFSHKSPKLFEKVMPRINDRVKGLFWQSTSGDEILECIQISPPKTTRN